MLSESIELPRSGFGGAVIFNPCACVGLRPKSYSGAVLVKNQPRLVGNADCLTCNQSGLPITRLRCIHNVWAASLVYSQACKLLKLVA